MLGYTKLIDMTKTSKERVDEEEMESKMETSDRKKDTDKKYINTVSAKYLLSHDKLKKFKPHTYERAAETYGLVICDINRVSNI